MAPQNKVKQTYSDPNKQLGFEIFPRETKTSWSFTPNFYPDKFTQMKKKELDRYGGKCGGESVSIKSIKNREFHAEGVILEGEVNLFQALLDHDKVVDIISPLTENDGMECFIKRGELKGQSGWDPHHQQWMFKYSLDLVSTGRDEHDTGRNAIVTAITSGSSSDENQELSYKGRPRKNWEFIPGLHDEPKENWVQDEEKLEEYEQEWKAGNISLDKVIEDIDGFTGYDRNMLYVL